LQEGQLENPHYDRHVGGQKTQARPHLSYHSHSQPALMPTRCLVAILGDLGRLDSASRCIFRWALSQSIPDRCVGSLCRPWAPSDFARSPCSPYVASTLTGRGWNRHEHGHIRSCLHTVCETKNKVYLESQNRHLWLSCHNHLVFHDDGRPGRNSHIGRRAHGEYETTTTLRRLSCRLLTVRQACFCQNGESGS
jgi:hypothetical protein